jgi:hypothetical protein
MTIGWAENRAAARVANPATPAELSFGPETVITRFQRSQNGILRWNRSS